METVARSRVLSVLIPRSSKEKLLHAASDIIEIVEGSRRGKEWVRVRARTRLSA